MSHELARLLLRLVRHGRRDDGGQAAARAVGAGAVGAGLRLQLAGDARAAGADGRGDGRRWSTTSTRRPLRPRRGVRRRPGAGADADHRGDLPPQQPRRAARAVLRRPRCGAWCGRSRTAARAGSCSSGVCVGLGFEAKMAAALLVVPGARGRMAVGGAERPPRRRAPAARGRRGDGGRRAAPGRCSMWLTPASGRPWISGTSDNSIWSLIVGYNGLGRLVGQAAARAAGRRPGRRWRRRDVRRRAGPLRLLNQALGGQAGWLLGFALVAGVGIAGRHAAAARATRAPAG